MKLLPAAGMIAAVACTRIVDPPLDTRAVPLQLPAVYARWFEMTKSCSGLSGSLSDITWYQIPGVDIVAEPNVSSYWSGGSNRIVLAGGVILNGSIVRHEMLHSLLGIDGHPRDYFLDKCAGAVTCSSACVSQAGAPPPINPDAPRLTPAELVITATLTPSRPTLLVDEGVFTLTVTATNPNSYPIVVPAGQAGLSRVFSYSFTPLANAPTSVVGWKQAFDIGITVFGPGETKTVYFDFSIVRSLGSPWIAAGNYRVTGGYGGKVATINNAVLGP
jgi:hypothetical protein